MENNNGVIYHLFGVNNCISKEIQSRISNENSIKYQRQEMEKIIVNNALNRMVIDENRIHKVVYSWGLLHSKRLGDQSYSEACQGYVWNFLIPMKLLELFNKTGVEFRFIYISSESAKKGSFDGNYAAQKAAAERFIRECQIINPRSSVLAVAPSMIGDGGMTTRRDDREAIQTAARTNPKGRLLLSKEVAEIIWFLLENSTTYISNTTIEINGGKFARMSYK